MNEVAEVAEEGCRASEEVGRVARGAEELTEDGHGVQEAAVGAGNAGADGGFVEGRTHHGRTHIVAGPIAGEELVGGVEFAEEGRSRVGNEPSGLEGGGGSGSEEVATEANGAFGVVCRFPGITKHERNMHVESCFGRGAGAFANGFKREAFVEAVERGLVRGFDAKEDESEAGAAHEAVVFKGECAETEVAVKADFAVVAAGNHAVAEVVEPLADGKATGVVHDFAHAQVDEHANFVEDVVHGANAIGGVERGPRTEGALAVPTVARTHDVSAGCAGKVAVAVGVVLPTRQGSVNAWERAEVNGNLASFKPGEERKVVVAALENGIDGGRGEGFFGEGCDVIARHDETAVR